MSGGVQNAFTNQGSIGGALENLGTDLLDSAVGALSPLNNFARYMTGARAIIKVNGKLFGFAFGVNFNINTATEEVWTIDDWTPYELAPQRISINGTLGMFFIPGKSPSHELVQSNVMSYLFHKYITIDITDQMTGQTIFHTEKAWITGRSQTLTAGELSTVQLSWKAIGWLDDLNPSKPVGADDSDQDPDSDGDSNPLTPSVPGWTGADSGGNGFGSGNTA
jgi:hypothetical protein